MFKIRYYRPIFHCSVLAVVALLVHSAPAIDVKEKLIVKAYNCSDFATDATITRPMLPFEFPTQQGPTRTGRGYSGGFSGKAPVEHSVQPGRGGQGGGLFGVSSKQAQGGGGLGGGGGVGGSSPASPQPQVRNEDVRKSTIIYQTKDLTEITNLIYETVDPKSWSLDHARPKIRKMGSILVITQTQKNHDEIQKLFTMLREARQK